LNTVVLILSLSLAFISFFLYSLFLFLLETTLFYAFLGKSTHVTDNVQDGTFLQILLHFSKKFEAKFHPIQANIVPVTLAHGIAPHLRLQSNCRLVLLVLNHVWPHSKLQVDSPCSLDLDRGQFANTANQTEPCSKFSFFKPRLNSYGSLHLSDREHLFAHH
jgi:hypothetical protein